MWNDAAMATLEVPLADPIGSPKQVPASYYYKMPVRPIYQSYPVYAPGHEPPGYMDWLRWQKPQIVWGVDPKTGVKHAPPLKTKADWIRAGEMVFSADAVFVGEHGGLFTLAEIRDKNWYEKVGMPTTRQGVLPFVDYLVRKKGIVEVGSFSCAMCHTRLVPDGTVLKGAQGNIPFDRALGIAEINEFGPTPEGARHLERMLYSAPWLKPDPWQREEGMSVPELASIHRVIPPGVLARHRSSPFYPIQVADLIGVKDRHYLDRTGLQQHRSIVDLMRYAALNNLADDLASYDGFIPGAPDFRTLPDPDKLAFTLRDRYSGEQLYALALYVYSLKPPPNPNKFGALAARGKKSL